MASSGSRLKQAIPIELSADPGFPELLNTLGCSLAVSSFQAGKVIFISPRGEKLYRLIRSFPRPMGMAFGNRRMAIALRDSVLVLANAPGLAPAYPNKPGAYSALYAPRTAYYTGNAAIHDIAWGLEGLWAVNTRYSCLCLIDHRYNFRPQWQPPFINRLAPEDRCHLNGMAMEKGQPLYSTALSMSNKAEGWRQGNYSQGVLMAVAPSAGDVAMHSLAMPHSPRLYDGRLFLLLAASGDVVEVDRRHWRCEHITRLDGFTRGLCKVGDYLFVGMSKLRKRHRFGRLPIEARPLQCGIAAVHLPSGTLHSTLRFTSGCEEIFDVAALPNERRPGIMNNTNPVHRQALSSPQADIWLAQAAPDHPTPAADGGFR